MPVFLFLKALPTWVKVGAGCGLIIAALQVQHWWTTRDLRRDLAKQEAALKTTQEEAAKAAAKAAQDLQLEAANREKLGSEIKVQNARIRDASAKASLAARDAALATIRSLKETQAEADALRDKSSTVPVGDAGMNAWMQQKFGGAK